MLGIMGGFYLILQQEYHKNDTLERATANLQASAAVLASEEDNLRDVARLTGTEFKRTISNPKEDYVFATSELNHLSQSRNQKILIFTIIGGFLFFGSCIFLSSKR